MQMEFLTQMSMNNIKLFSLRYSIEWQIVNIKKITSNRLNILIN